MKIIYFIFACELFIVISARPTFDKIAEVVLDAIGESVYPSPNIYPPAHQSSYGYHGGYGGYQYEHHYGEDREGAGYQQQGSYGPPPYYAHPKRYLEPPPPPPAVAYLPSPHRKPHYGYGYQGNQHNQHNQHNPHNYGNEYSDPAIHEYQPNINYGYQPQPTYHAQGYKTHGY